MKKNYMLLVILYSSRAFFNLEEICSEYFTTMGALFNSKGMCSE